VTAGACVRTRRLAARLMILAVFAMMLGQVVAMPAATLSLNAATFSDRQSALDQDEPSAPCQHHGNTHGFACCLVAGCPMLTLALPIAPPGVLPTELHLLAYTQDAMRSPDGTGDAPLVPPPRRQV
jgi:hypothetical protein